MEIDAKLVAELRRRTGLPMMKCKEALAEAGGDLALAAENLRKQGVRAAEKVADRELKEGLVFQHAAGGGACAVALLCQTDFVARSKDFTAFGEQLAKDLFAKAPQDTGSGESLSGFRLSDGTTVKQRLEDLALKIRENIQVGRYARFPGGNGYVAVYVHHNGKIACLVDLAGRGLDAQEAVRELGKHLGMQIAFHADVQALTRDQLDPAWVAKEREIFAAQAAEMPEERREKITEGKLAKRLKDVLLLDQPYIRDDKETVQQHVAAVAKQAGTAVSVRRFARIAAGA